MVLMRPGLGRLYASDERDHDFSVTRRLVGTAAAPIRTFRYWNAEGWWGDQESTSQCVAYAWTHWLEDGPVTQPGTAPIVIPQALYDAAQRVDEWPGEDYEGTSVRAGAKVLQSNGLISAYHWAFSLANVIDTVLNLGPMVVGTNWYDVMFEPDEAGFLHVDGALAGGHAWVIDGVNTKAGIFRMKNSWGRSWGHNGLALISFADFDQLLREDGEACIATEVKARG
jgi:hypothetical protein